MNATQTKATGKQKAASTQAGARRSPREGSVIWAAIQVLTDKRKPMTPEEIYAEIHERKLARRLQGKTPEATVASTLAVHAARGLYVERPEPGKYQLKKDTNTKAAATGARAKTAPTGARSKRASKSQEPPTAPAQGNEPEQEAETRHEPTEPAAPATA